MISKYLFALEKKPVNKQFITKLTDFCFFKFQTKANRQSLGESSRNTLKVKWSRTFKLHLGLALKGFKVVVKVSRFHPT